MFYISLFLRQERKASFAPLYVWDSWMNSWSSERFS